MAIPVTRISRYQAYQYEWTVDEGPTQTATEYRFAALVTVNRQNVWWSENGQSGNMASVRLCAVFKESVLMLSVPSLCCAPFCTLCCAVHIVIAYLINPRRTCAQGYCSRFVCLFVCLSKKHICQLVLVNVQLKALVVQAGCIHGFKTGVFPKNT